MASACFKCPCAYNMFLSFQVIKSHLLLTAEASEHVSQFSPLFFPLPLIKTTGLGNGVSRTQHIQLLNILKKRKAG